MNVVWSEQAKNSLADIYDFIYEDNPSAAQKVLEVLLDKANSLNDERIEYPKDPYANSESSDLYFNGAIKLFMKEQRKK